MKLPRSGNENVTLEFRVTFSFSDLGNCNNFISDDLQSFHFGLLATFVIKFVRTPSLQLHTWSYGNFISVLYDYLWSCGIICQLGQREELWGLSIPLKYCVRFPKSNYIKRFQFPRGEYKNICAGKRRNSLGTFLSLYEFGKAQTTRRSHQKHIMSSSDNNQWAKSFETRQEAHLQETLQRSAVWRNNSDFCHSGFYS